MKVLWITNTMLPEMAKAINHEVYIGESWLVSSLLELKKEDNLQFAIAAFYDGGTFIEKRVNGLVYYYLPQRNSTKKHSEYWKKVENDFFPDIVHIHGTELASGLLYIKTFGCDNVVVSIQGLISVCERYAFGGINIIQQLKYTTIRDVLKLDLFFNTQRKFRSAAIKEIELLKMIKNIIGRTQWDKTHLDSINKLTNYYFCNETLRPSFYINKWSIEQCQKHSIFVSSGRTPLKGFHQLLKALPYVIREFPDVKVYVAGYDWVSTPTLISRLKIKGYNKYLKYLINSLSLEDKIIFTGGLSEEKMCEMFLKSNVFVLPSSIENSPNSLGEAQILGVPCIASYVGGVPDMIEHGKTGFLYRFEETEMLASLICKVFSMTDSKDESFQRLCENEIIVASERHDKENNKRTTLNIYQSILNQKEFGG